MNSENSKSQQSDLVGFSDRSESKSKEQLEYDKQKIIEIGDSLKDTYEKLESLIRLGINSGRINNSALDDILESLEDSSLKKLLKG